MKEMTRRQREVLDFVRTFSERHGVPPAVREIGERFGFTARAAFDHLRALERKGMLERRVTNKRASRTLVLPGRRGTGHRGVRDEIPVLGRIAAGAPILAVENREDSIPLRPEWLRAQGEEVFALRVRGDSMVGAHIVDGDFVMVRRQDSAASGDIVAALIDGEATVKRFAREGGHHPPRAGESRDGAHHGRARSGRTFAFSERSSVFCAACDGRGEDGHGRRTNEHASAALVPRPPGRARRAGASARVARKPVEASGERLFFCGRISQHMERPSAADWLAGGAMLLAAASWGLLAALLS